MRTALWPADAGGGGLGGQDLARGRALKHARGAVPFLRYQEEGLPVGAAEHAREAAAVECDRLQHFATLADAHAALVGNVGVPDGVVGFETDTVGHTVAEVGPDASIGQ